MNTIKVDRPEGDERAARLALLRRQLSEQIRRRANPLLTSSTSVPPAGLGTSEGSGSRAARVESGGLSSSSGSGCSSGNSSASRTDGKQMDFAARRKRSALERLKSSTTSSNDTPSSVAKSTVVDLSIKMARLHSPMKTDDDVGEPRAAVLKGRSLHMPPISSTRDTVAQAPSTGALGASGMQHALVPYPGACSSHVPPTGVPPRVGGTGAGTGTGTGILVYNVEMNSKTKMVSLATLRQLALTMPHSYPVQRECSHSKPYKGANGSVRPPLEGAGEQGTVQGTGHHATLGQTLTCKAMRSLVARHLRARSRDVPPRAGPAQRGPVGTRRNAPPRVIPPGRAGPCVPRDFLRLSARGSHLPPHHCCGMPSDPKIFLRSAWPTFHALIKSSLISSSENRGTPGRHARLIFFAMNFRSSSSFI